MLVNGEVLLSADCPVSGDWNGSLKPENFEAAISFLKGPEITEVYAEFYGSYDGIFRDFSTTSGMGWMFKEGDRQGERVIEFVEQTEVIELGKIFCSKVAECTGPLTIDGPPICPALNNFEFGKLVENGR